jgi:NTE family protein
MTDVTTLDTIATLAVNDMNTIDNNMDTLQTIEIDDIVPAPIMRSTPIDPFIENLVIGGGGTAGYTYMGALRTLFSEEDPRKNKLSEVKNFIGTSAGSIMCTILSCTTDQEYLYNRFSSMNIQDLQDNSFGVIRDMIRLYRKFGWNKGDYALSIAHDIMEELTGNRHLTFAQHYELTGNNLIITGTNTSTQNVVYFNRLTHPNMEVAKAVRISISLPIIFVPIAHTNEKFREVIGGTNLYVDGGLTSNYPFDFVFTELYDLLQTDGVADDTAIVHDNDGSRSFNLISDDIICEALKKIYLPHDSDRIVENEELKLSRTLGIKSFSRESIDSIDHTYADIPDREFNVKSHIGGLIDIMMNATLKSHINEKIWNRTIKIDISGINTTDFDIDDNDKQNMINIGTRYATEFIAKHEP